MAYPPPVPPATRTDATVMATNHPADHNLISAALTEILNHIATMEQALYPIGTISMVGSDLAPGNHLLCQGQAVSKTTYPEVFALIGTKFNTGGEQATEFRMPAMQGRCPVGFYPGGGWAATLGGMFGNANSTLPSHQHAVTGADHQHGVSIWSDLDDTNHIHFPDSGGQFVMTGAGSGGTAGIGPGTGYSLGMPAGRSAQHRHAVNGGTSLADRSLLAPTDFRGADPTNTNLPPSITLNFVMRMH